MQSERGIEIEILQEVLITLIFPLDLASVELNSELNLQYSCIRMQKKFIHNFPILYCHCGCCISFTYIFYYFYCISWTIFYFIYFFLST